LFDAASFLRVVAFAIVFAGIEYRYVNRYEKEWTKTAEGFVEKPVFWVISPYHAFLLLPLFIVASFTLPITAWAGNTFLLAVAEDIAYFVWRGKAVVDGDWTTTLFGSFKLGGFVIPTWWPLDLLIAAALYWVPL
jgi:nitrate reductase gamma subunit